MASLALRYARALLAAAVTAKSLEQVSEEVAFFQHLYQENEDFRLFLNAPEINRNQKIRVVQELFRERLSNTFSGFLLILLKHRRQDTFPEIASKFASLYNQ
ncbi:MAG: ATP synthase F1 subunit delta, partial [candidate division KSB1 bacterium]|nr:ATP synthase F1 subunit delta [candidate division KSB1 bacterium]